MSRDIIFVLMYHRHKRLGLIYFSYGLAIEWYVKYAAIVAGGDGGRPSFFPPWIFKKSKLKKREIYRILVSQIKSIYNTNMIISLMPYGGQ
jgi:hypothetical protein